MGKNSVSPLRLAIDAVSLFLGAAFMYFFVYGFLGRFAAAANDFAFDILAAAITAALCFLFAFGSVKAHFNLARFFCLGATLLVFADEAAYIAIRARAHVIAKNTLGEHLPFAVSALSLLFSLLLRQSVHAFRGLRLAYVPGNYVLARFMPGDTLDGKLAQSPSRFFSAVRTQDELSVIAEEGVFLQHNGLYSGMQLFKMQNERFNGEPNLRLGQAVKPLRKAHIPFLCSSTYNTSYILIKNSDLSKALRLWRRHGVKAEGV